MSGPRYKDWLNDYELGQLAISRMDELFEAWSDDLDDKDESLETTRQELEDARLEAAKPPEWGNCKRGCPPAYIDSEGFCSPACKLGAPRGEFVTLPPPPKLAPQWLQDNFDDYEDA